MSTEIVEAIGRRIGNNRAERRYLVRGSTSDAEVEAAVRGEAPESILLDGGRSLLRDEIDVEELTTDPPLWLGTVSYGRPGGELPEPAVESEFSFETRGGTQRIMQSLQTVAGYPSNTAEWARPNFGKAVNVTADNQVEGVDVTYPVFNFSITRFWETISESYIGDLYSLTGTVNNGGITITTADGASISFAAGELLFLGAAGGRRGEGLWEINYSFAASPNATDLSVGDITGIDKKGWEYLWVYYKQQKDDPSKNIIPKPYSAYVEQVYRTANHGLLNL